MSHVHVDACPNCGAALDGRYCQNCGQKRITAHELTVKHFLHQAFHELTHLESTASVRTLTTLIVKPGKLTNEYLAGHRRGYIEPLRLYLSISAIFFLFAWPRMLQGTGEARILAGLQPLAQARHLDPQALAERFGHYVSTYGGAARFGSALVLALMIQWLYSRTKRYYIEHLIFALHYISFSFLLSCALELIRLGLRAGHVRMPQIPGMHVPFLFLYMFVALRTVYKQSIPLTFVKALALAFGELGLFIASTAVAAAAAILILLLT